MANETTELSIVDDDVQIVQNATTEMSNDAFMAMLEKQKDVFDALQDTEKVKPAMSISLKYKNFDTAGVEERFIFMGYTTITSKGKEIDCVILATKEQSYISGSMKVVSSIKGFNIPLGTPVQICYKGEVKTPNGSMKDFEISILSIQ